MLLINLLFFFFYNRQIHKSVFDSESEGFPMTFRGQKRASDALELGVQTVFRAPVGAGN